MLRDLLIFAVVLVLLDVGVKYFIARFLVNKVKTKCRRRVTFSMANWHRKRLRKLERR